MLKHLRVAAASLSLIAVSAMPALAQACLTTACVFWRGVLIDVWYTNFSLRPSFSRTPSEPRFQPAASST